MVDDAAVVRAVLSGRTECFAELVERHAEAVFRVVRSAVRQEADAEDLAQEIFLASFRGLASLREPSRYRGHLLVIAARRAADYLRGRKRGKELLALDEEPPAPAPLDHTTRIEAVQAVLATLPPDARLVFALRHHEGYSCKQIAGLVGVAEGTVYSRLSRIHALMRKAAEVSES